MMRKEDDSGRDGKGKRSVYYLHTASAFASSIDGSMAKDYHKHQDSTHHHRLADLSHIFHHIESNRREANQSSADLLAQLETHNINAI